MEEYERPAKVLLNGSGPVGCVLLVLLVLSGMERDDYSSRPKDVGILADSVSALRDSICQHVRYSLGRERHNLSGHDLFLAVALAVRDRLVDRMLETEERYQKADAKRLYYLSMEFLMGRALGNNLSNLGILDRCQEALQKIELELEAAEESEGDAALGNGGLGRLAACFLDSLATLDMPGYGYGINYEYGVFKQEIDDGYQKEKPDNWLAHGTPWEIERPDEACLVPVYGRIEHALDRSGAQRRWLLKGNSSLARLINRTIGVGWITDLGKLKTLESYAEEDWFQHEFLNIKRSTKNRFARVIKETTSVIVDPDSLFDIQAKRIHEYKRQLLNIMHIIHEYLCVIEDDHEPIVPRTYIFAGKAAPGYWAAKLIIKLINNVGRIVNNDPRVKGRIKVVFIPDYRVSLAEKIIPAADLSEQISTAGKEASGTGNMKFAMNGALTIGTLDGANIEIMEEVGKDNIFIFGLKAEDIEAMRNQRSYNPWDYYHRNPFLERVMNSFNSNLFCPEEPDLFSSIYQSLLDHGDEYFHLADLQSYIEAQDKVGEEFKRPAVWARKAILNVARIGKFSSDRTIREYAREIWNIESV
jgi:glucan phosphorylase